MEGIKYTELMGENVLPLLKYCGENVRVFQLSKIINPHCAEIDDCTLIIESKNLQYYTIVADFRSNIIGAHQADKHYIIDAMNYDDVYNMCVNENIDGIVTNSEPLVPIATQVAEKLNLKGNRYSSIKKMMSKYEFRRVQEEVDIYHPQNIVVNNETDVINEVNYLKFPIIIKPCESSGSRGTTIINKKNNDELESAIKKCSSLSRNGLAEIEEYIEMPSLTTIEGEIFVCNKEILWDGLFFTTRSNYLPTIPMTYSFPLDIEKSKLDKIEDSIKKIFDKLDIQFGEFNIEGYFTCTGEFFVVEINARQGGMHLPEFVSKGVGINYSKLLVSVSVGDYRYWNDCKIMKKNKRYISQHSVFSREKGVLDQVIIDPLLQTKIIDRVIHKNKGEFVDIAKDYSDVIEIITFEFDSLQEQNIYFAHLEDYIGVTVI